MRYTAEKEVGSQIIVCVPQHNENGGVFDEVTGDLGCVNVLLLLHDLDHLEELDKGIGLAQTRQLSQWCVETPLFVVY